MASTRAPNSSFVSARFRSLFLGTRDHDAELSFEWTIPPGVWTMDNVLSLFIEMRLRSSWRREETYEKHMPLILVQRKSYEYRIPRRVVSTDERYANINIDRSMKMTMKTILEKSPGR